MVFRIFCKFLEKPEKFNAECARKGKFQEVRHLHDFQGALQDVRLVSGAAGYLLQCPQADAECPTCGQFQILSDQVNQLQQLVSQLSIRVRILIYS